VGLTSKKGLGVLSLMLYVSIFYHFFQRLTEVTLTIIRAVLLRMRNFSVKNCVGRQNTLLCAIKCFLQKSCCLGDNEEKYGTAGQATDVNIIRRRRIACWLPKVTNTQSEYAIFIVVALQQRLHKHVPALRYT
jgi:hypothetical protein